MADWKDFYEDNRESWGQYLDSLGREEKATRGSKAAPSPQVEFCPLCHGAFLEGGLAGHIRSVHGPQHIYLASMDGLFVIWDGLNTAFPNYGLFNWDSLTRL